MQNEQVRYSELILLPLRDLLDMFLSYSSFRWAKFEDAQKLDSFHTMNCKY